MTPDDSEYGSIDPVMRNQNNSGTSIPGKQELVRRLNSAISTDDEETRCQNVKSVLSHLVERGIRFARSEHLEPDQTHYARHLVHLDPEGRYSVLAMVWAPGQGTPLHDHAGNWCVECVYRGRIRVTSYELQNDSKREEPLYFEEKNQVTSGLADAGVLIPPFEYHEINNPFDEPAVTIHVYRGEMDSCNAFYPLDEERGYRKETKSLTYTSRLPDSMPGNE